MLYKMSFSQLLTMIETRNERERKAYEAAEEAARQREDGGDGYVPPPKPKNIDNPEDLPTVSDIQRLFGGGGMMG